MVLIAQRYANAIMGLSRNSLDRALAVHCLQERFAIPTILYGAEAIKLSNGVIESLDRIQHSIARFILQLPKSAARISSAMNAGLMPMQDRANTRIDKWAVQEEALNKAVGAICSMAPRGFKREVYGIQLWPRSSRSLRMMEHSYRSYLNLSSFCLTPPLIGGYTIVTRLSDQPASGSTVL